MVHGGDGANGGDAGTVTVTDSGTITTGGANALGIFARSLGGNGGSGGSASALVANGGTGGAGGSAGTVAVTLQTGASIVTTGAGAYALDAESTGGTGGSGGNGAAFVGNAAGGGAGWQRRCGECHCRWHHHHQRRRRLRCPRFEPWLPGRLWRHRCWRRRIWRLWRRRQQRRPGDRRQQWLDHDIRSELARYFGIVGRRRRGRRRRWRRLGRVRRRRPICTSRLCEHRGHLTDCIVLFAMTVVPSR